MAPAQGAALRARLKRRFHSWNCPGYAGTGGAALATRLMPADPPYAGTALATRMPAGFACSRSPMLSSSSSLEPTGLQ
eukprot:16436863-Heterocapsa_arctica.AAC.1